MKKLLCMIFLTLPILSFAGEVEIHKANLITIPVIGGIAYSGMTSLDAKRDIKAIDNNYKEYIRYTGQDVKLTDDELKKLVSKFNPGDQAMSVHIDHVEKLAGQSLTSLEKIKFKASTVDLTEFQKILDANHSKDVTHQKLLQALRTELDNGKNFKSLYRITKSDFLARKVFKKKFHMGLGFLGTGIVSLGALSAYSKSQVDSDRFTPISKGDLESKKEKPAYKASKQ